VDVLLSLRLNVRLVLLDLLVLATELLLLHWLWSPEALLPHGVSPLLSFVVEFRIAWKALIVIIFLRVFLFLEILFRRILFTWILVVVVLLGLGLGLGSLSFSLLLLELVLELLQLVLSNLCLLHLPLERWLLDSIGWAAEVLLDGWRWLLLLLLL